MDYLFPQKITHQSILTSTQSKTLQILINLETLTVPSLKIPAKDPQSDSPTIYLSYVSFIFIFFSHFFLKGKKTVTKPDINDDGPSQKFPISS